MTDNNKEKATPALPMWRPRQAATKRMTPSISFDSKTQIKTYRPPRPKKAPERKPAQRYEIEVKDVKPSRHSEGFAVAPAYKPELVGERDSLVSEYSAAVQLPLAPKQPLPTAADILAPVRGDKLMLVQLPSSLPIVYPNDGSQMDYNPLFTAADGRIGEIHVYRSGRVTAKIGNVEFDVEGGIPASCLQFAVVKGKDDLEFTTVPPNKLKFTVDVQKIQEGMAKESA